MLTVWLVRHGESEANAGLPTLNPTVTPLTEKGQWQAQQIAISLTRAPDLIVTSPYWRTQQTARPTRERFPEVPHQEWQVQEFTYLAPKRYQNTTIEQRRPMSDAYWLENDPLYVDGEGAESFADLLERVRVTQQQLHQLDAEFAVVFSHGRFIRALLWAVLTQSIEASPRRMRQFNAFIGSFPVPNGSILRLQVQSGEIWFSGIDAAHLVEEVAYPSPS